MLQWVTPIALSEALHSVCRIQEYDLLIFFKMDREELYSQIAAWQEEIGEAAPGDRRT